jgi:hypothetical protein
VLPCLDELLTTIVVCGALARHGLTGDFSSFLKNPVKWFASRGVRRVVFVQRDEDNGEGLPPPGPDDRREGERVEAARDGRPCIAHTISSREGLVRPNEKAGLAGAEVVITGPSARIDLDIVRPGIEWLLMPYVHPFEREQLAVFRRAIKRKLSTTRGPASSAFRKRLLKSLADPKSRRELQHCYGILARNHNEVSLSLYSGPGPGNGAAWRMATECAMWRHCEGVTERVAWLCTGDANLKLDRTRQPWLLRHASLLSKTAIFQLPHHGSTHNLAREVVDRLGDIVYMVCAARGRRKHPHPIVRNLLRTRGFALTRINERRGSAFNTVATA